MRTDGTACDWYALRVLPFVLFEAFVVNEEPGLIIEETRLEITRHAAIPLNFSLYVSCRNRYNVTENRTDMSLI